jgi:hypothetical protein
MNFLDLDHSAVQAGRDGAAAFRPEVEG